MNKKIIIQTAKDGNVQLASVQLKDAERLRIWKNRHRYAFFYQGIITKSQQAKWIRKYLRDNRNFMFMVKYRGISIGCMGFRKRRDGGDIYNTILGRKEFARKGIMSRALKIMCRFMLDTGIKRIYLKVLQTNIAGQRWYRKNGFRKTKEGKGYFLFKLHKLNYPKNTIIVEEGGSL